MVFYRKYRPQKIEELDNESVRQSLYSIFSKQSSIHAFLFTGPKGLGKTSTARIIAKVVNCTGQRTKNPGLAKQRGAGKEQKIGIEPDNKCQQCTSISNGNNLDVLEIDGASNRGIDEIRDLKEKINLAPFKASKKIYIIDEVHMLTTEAFNALLKTLEEPPAHAVFILCTTEPHKVPATIASRCFRINFTRATEDELVRSLQRIVKGEGIKIDKEALFEIAKLSDGSFRDGAKILEEVATFAGRKTITADLVNEKNNTLGISESVSQMLNALIEKDIKKGLLICRDLSKQGMDFKFFIEELIERLHLMLLMEAGVEKADDSPRPRLAEMKKLFELLSGAYQETKFAVLPQMPLELAILEWAEENGNFGFSRQPHVSDDARSASSGNRSKTRSLSESLLSGSKNKQNKNATAFDSSESGLPPFATISKNSFSNDLIEEVKKNNHLLAGVLRSCSVEEIKNEKLIIIAKSNFHKEKLEETKNLRLIEDALEKMLKRNINVKISLGGDLSE